MTLRRDEQRARERMLDAKRALLDYAITVAHGRANGTLTADQLDELRDAAQDYRRATRAFLAV